MAQSSPSLINLRDVGEFINKITGRELLVRDVLFRSAVPDYSNEAELRQLKDVVGVSTLLDLRTDTERLHQPQPSSAISCLGLKSRVVNLNGRSYTTALMKQLSYWQSAQLIGYYAVGYRKHAISILGENVLAKRGLVGLAEDSLSCSTAEIKAVFDLLAEEASLPILIHCTQGKDRTGLVVLLILMLLNVPVEAIEQDYALSQMELQPEREQRLKDIRSIGLPDSFADCEPNWANIIADWIGQSYGGIAEYLEHCGVCREAQSYVKSRFIKEE